MRLLIANSGLSSKGWDDRRKRIVDGLEIGFDNVPRLGALPALEAVRSHAEDLKRQLADLGASDTPAQLARLKQRRS